MTRQFFQKVLERKFYITRRYCYVAINVNNLKKIVRYKIGETKRMRKDYTYNLIGIEYEVVAVFA